MAGMIKRFLRFEIFQSGIFWGQEIIFGCVDLRRDLFEVFKTI